jgi:DNA-binding transcriptional regulator GbsR (MarR family)
MRIFGFSKTTISKAINKLIKLNILNSRIENYEFNNKKRYLTLVNNVWKNNNMGIEENNDTCVKEEFTYNNNYKYVNNELVPFINNNTIIDNGDERDFDDIFN